MSDAHCSDCRRARCPARFSARTCESERRLRAQTGLAEKAKAYGVNLPSSAPGAAPAAPAAEKAAVAAAAPGIVKARCPLREYSAQRPAP